MKLRIKFRKQGDLRFIGHLDIMRYFQKLIRRAGIPIRYSEGFNPHQVMSFASPLSVGHLSLGEYCDIDVHEAESSEDMVSRLNAAGVPGLTVTSCRLLPDGTKNAMSVTAAADYRVWFKEGKEPENPGEFWERAAAFARRDSIPYVKHTKKGDRETDLGPLVYEAYFEASIPEHDGGCGMFLKLSQGSSANAKPEQVLDAFYLSEGQEYPALAIQVERMELYADEGADGEHRFRSLEDYGAEF